MANKLILKKAMVMMFAKKKQVQADTRSSDWISNGKKKYVPAPPSRK